MWMSPFLEYLKDDRLLSDLVEAKKLVKDAAKYIIFGEQLYRQGFSFPLLRCVEGKESWNVIKEVHEGVCSTHIGGRALARKIARAGPFPTTLGQVKYLIMAVDYFTKWIEAESVAMISTKKIKRFYWSKIICWFGLSVEIDSVCFSVNCELLCPIEDKTTIHVGGTPIIKQTGRGYQQGHPKGIAETSQ
ncbi:hypothetical protein CR513_56007, partial [Mucuna pruriens]